MEALRAGKEATEEVRGLPTLDHQGKDQCLIQKAVEESVTQFPYLCLKGRVYSR